MREVYYSLIITQLLDYVGFLIVATLAFKIAYPKENSQRNSQWLSFILATIFFILLFGRGYGVAASVSIMLLGCLGLLKTPRIKELWIIIFILLGVSAFYLMGLTGNESSLDYSFNLVAMLNFLIAKFGNAHIGMFVLMDHFSGTETESFIAGIILLFVYAFAVLQYIRSKHVNGVDWIAMFMILMSLNSLLMISLFRYTDTPLFSRHNLEISLGFVGAVYFVVKFVCERLDKSFAKAFIMSICFCFGALSVNHHFNLISFAKNTQFYDGIETNQSKFFKLSNPSKDFKILGTTCYLTVPECVEAFNLIKKHGISEKRYKEK